MNIFKFGDNVPKKCVKLILTAIFLRFELFERLRASTVQKIDN